MKTQAVAVIPYVDHEMSEEARSLAYWTVAMEHPFDARDHELCAAFARGTAARLIAGEYES